MINVSLCKHDNSSKAQHHKQRKADQRKISHQLRKMLQRASITLEDWRVQGLTGSGSRGVTTGTGPAPDQGLLGSRSDGLWHTLCLQDPGTRPAHLPQVFPPLSPDRLVTWCRLLAHFGFSTGLIVIRHFRFSPWVTICLSVQEGNCPYAQSLGLCVHSWFSGLPVPGAQDVSGYLSEGTGAPHARPPSGPSAAAERRQTPGAAPSEKARGHSQDCPGIMELGKSPVCWCQCA